MPAIQHQDVVEPLTPQRSDKALADGVHFRRTDGRADQPDAAMASTRASSASRSIMWIASGRRGRERNPSSAFPPSRSSAARFRTLLVVHRRGDSGSPRVTGSISDSKSRNNVGSVSVTCLRPAPGRRIRCACAGCAGGFRRTEASLKPWIRFAEVVRRSGYAERGDQGFCEADPTGERFGECAHRAQVLVEGNRDGSL